jgi:hypothetical protein
VEPKAKNSPLFSSKFQTLNGERRLAYTTALPVHLFGESRLGEKYFLLNFSTTYPFNSRFPVRPHSIFASETLFLPEVKK